MGFLDNAKAKLTKAVDDHGDKIAGGIDRASAAIDGRTGGKHSDKIATGAAKAKEALDRLDGKSDVRATTTPEPDPTIPTHPAPVDPTDPLPGPPTDPSNPTGSLRP